jgi:hypothetical protein
LAKEKGKKETLKKNTPETVTDGDTGNRTPMENLGEIRAELKQQETEPPKKKRGPYKKKEKDDTPTEPEFQLDIDAKDFEIMLRFLFGIIAQRRGAHWNLQPEELSTGAELFAKLAQKYFPLLGQWALEIQALIFMGGVIGQRIAVEIMIKRAREDSNKKEPDGITE